MKKNILVFICLFALILSLFACSNDTGNNDDIGINGDTGNNDDTGINGDDNNDDTPTQDENDNTPVFDGTAIVGLWQLYSVNSEGKIYHLGEVLHGQTLRADMMIMDLKADGTGIYILSISYGGDPEEEKFNISWETVNESWIVHINGIDSETTLEGNNLIMYEPYNQETFTFIKKSENAGGVEDKTDKDETDELNGEYGLHHIIVENITSGDKRMYNVGDTYYGMLLSADTIHVVLNNRSGVMSYTFESSVTTNIIYDIVDGKFIMTCDDAVDLFNDGNLQYRYEMIIEEIDNKVCFVLTASNGYSIFSYYVIEQ